MVIKMTCKKKRCIPVRIVLSDYIDDFNRYVGELGAVTPAQAQQIIDAFAVAQTDTNSCIQTMSLEHKTCVQFGRTPFQNNIYSSIDMENLFYFDTMPKCTACNNKETNEEKKYKTCHRNFRNGRCVDKNMREILGKILYPQHYGKQK